MGLSLAESLGYSVTRYYFVEVEPGVVVPSNEWTYRLLLEKPGWVHRLDEENIKIIWKPYKTGPKVRENFAVAVYLR